jgi:isopenicillin-N N-acyltransferase-like protein
VLEKVLFSSCVERHRFVFYEAGLLGIDNYNQLNHRNTDTKMQKFIRITFILLLLAAAQLSAAERKLIEMCGEGYLETVDGYRVLHVKGSPEQMGIQHGTLLKAIIKSNVDFLFSHVLDNDVQIGENTIPRSMIASQLIGQFQYRIPDDYMTEMKAIARAAELPEWKIVGANLIPELFHCSGFALLKDATAGKKLYHGRVLDYGIDWKLQECAVLIIAEPEGKIPFVNVSYAGFIGSVTGMNLRQVSIGEMGGKGVGQWDGMPMSFLVRKVLDGAETLDEAVAVFTENKRTCEYYYVIADAKADSAVGLRCVPEAVDIVKPGQFYDLLPNPVKNTVLLSAGDRYLELSKRTAEQFGSFTEQLAIRLMDYPVATKNANLHNVLMIPEDARLYVANADPNGQGAWQQRYHHFDIKKLMLSKPENK